MALLTVVTMTGCGAREEQQSRHPAARLGRLGAEDPGLRGRAWDMSRRGVLAAGGAYSLALNADGTVWAWGGNASDQMGDGVSSLHSTPARTRLPCRFTGMPSGAHRTSQAEHCPATP